MQPEIVAIQRELKALRREARRQRRRAWLIPLVALLALVPLVAQAANPFTDLNPGSPHNANIDAIYNAHVTTGCVPNQQYCPNGNVTREEMASFLARIGGLGANAPVANAKTALTATSADTATNASNAGNAAAVNGFAANALVRAAAAGSGDTANLVPTGVYQAFAQVTVIAPGAGFVFVVGAVDCYAVAPYASDALVSSEVRDTGASVASYPISVMVGTYIGDNYEASLSPTTVFAVAAGSHTFALDVGRNSAATGSTAAWHATISALYVPFGAGGAQGADLPGTIQEPTAPPERHK